MSRPHKPILAFGVFSPSGRLETTRHSKDEAETAASIIGGTQWEVDGFTVEPVEVTRFPATRFTNTEMME